MLPTGGSLADALYGCKALSGDVAMGAQWHKCLIAVSRVLAEANSLYDSARFEHRAVHGHNLVKACRASQTGCANTKVA